MADGPRNAEPPLRKLAQTARQIDIQAAQDSARCNTGLDSNQRRRGNSHPCLPAVGHTVSRCNDGRQPVICVL
jgi:hypothetical protein